MKARITSRWGLQRWVSALLLAVSFIGALAWMTGMICVRRDQVGRESILPAMAEIQPSVDMARQAVMDYFSAADDTKRMQFIHDRNRVEPIWMDYHRRRHHPLPILEEIRSAALVEERGRTLALCEVAFSPGGVKPLAMIWEGRGFLLDWESLVAYGTVDWVEWVEARPPGRETLRVYLSSAPPGPLSETPSRDRIVIVDHRDALSPLPARVDPDAGMQIDFDGRQRVPVTAEFQFRSDPDGMQLHLVRILHEGWTD
jgi:hypothetical protein